MAMREPRGHESVLLHSGLEKPAESSDYARFDAFSVTPARLIRAWRMCIVQPSERGIPLLYNRVSCAWHVPGTGFLCLWRNERGTLCGMLMRNLWVVVSQYVDTSNL